MSLPITDDLGVVQSSANPPVAWNAGLGYDTNGKLCVTTVVSASDVYIGGKRRSLAGALVITNSTAGGQPWNYNAGWPMDKNTGATIVQTGIPASTDPRVAGIAIGPLGGVYMTTGSGFTPLDLFANGEHGFWYDPSDFSTMFQDESGTVPVTAVEQPVGLILDKSGRGNNAIQPTATARPILSARVNLFEKTEQFDNAYWNKQGATITPNVVIAPDGTLTMDKLVEGISTGLHNVNKGGFSFVAGKTYRLTAYVQASERTKGQIRLGNSTVGFGGAGNCSAVFDLIAKTITTPTNGTSSIEDLTGGIFRVKITATANNSANDFVFSTELSNGATVNYTGDGVSGMYIWGAQIQVFSGADKYQRVNTATDYNTSGFGKFLRFDGVDDFLQTAAFSMAPGKVTIFAGTANAKTTGSGTLCEFSPNYLNNVGSFAALTPSLSTSNVSFGSNGGGGAGEKQTQDVPAGQLRPRVLTMAQDFATVGDFGCDFIRVNQIPIGNLVGSGNSAVGAGPFGTYKANIGAREGGTTNRLQGNIYSLITAGNIYSNATMVLTEEWIDNKLNGV